jgi:hypothetical protein
MADHYAVCLSVSQGAYDTRASCHLIFADQHFETMMCIEWGAPPPPPRADVHRVAHPPPPE